METTFTTYNAKELIQLTLQKILNPNPIPQRPPVSQGFDKYIKIIRSLLNNYTIGMLTLRDITNDPELQKIYNGAKYLVIDGGHRVRAMSKYFEGDFAVDNIFWSEMSNDVDLASFNIPCTIVVCTSEEATQMFRNINQSTHVNFMEMVMSNETSAACKEVRSRTKYYEEYKNTPHELFISSSKDGKKFSSHYWDMEPNHRRKWDEYTFVSLLKAVGGGNVNAGQKQIEPYAETEIPSKTALSVVDRMFTDAVNFKIVRGKKFNTDDFNCFQVVWFGLFELNKEFKISDMKQFQESFMAVYSRLTGRKSDLDEALHEYEGEKHLLKEFFRSKTKNFANSDDQKECFNIFYKYFSNKPTGVIFREEKRSFNEREREQLLSIQGYACAIDGLPLTLADSVLGHDTPWAKGGELAKGAVIRKEHNRDMGSITINEYKLILGNRGQLSEAA